MSKDLINLWEALEQGLITAAEFERLVEVRCQ